MLVYVVYFLLIAIVSVEYEQVKFNKAIPILIFIIALSFLAGLRGPFVSKDYATYQYSFKAVDTYFNDLKRGDIFGFFEPGYLIVVAALKNVSELNATVLLMLFFALASIILKLTQFNKLVINPFVATLFYFSLYYPLMEMAQIRIGLASAIFFVAMNKYLERRYVYFSVLVLLATMFHYSAILYLFIFFINTKKLNRILYVGFLLATLILAIVKLPLLDILNSINPSLVIGKVKGYETALKYITDMKINVFNAVFIVNFLVSVYVLLFVKKDELEKDSNMLLFLKCTIFSLLLLAFLAGVPSLAFRVSELFGLVSVCMYASLVKYLPFKKANIFVVVLIAVLFFFVTYFHNDLVGPYNFVNII